MKNGPPPNWRDYEKKGPFGRVKFDHKKYIADVEAYIIAQHERMWELICELDNEREISGELNIQRESLLKKVLDSTLLSPTDYLKKYEEKEH